MTAQRSIVGAVLLTAALVGGIGPHTAPAHAAAGATAAAAFVPAATGAETVAFENRMNTALQRMLDAVVGPGRAVVTTAAELDLDEIETVTTTYARDPAAGALSERISRSSYTDGSGGTRYESTRDVRVNALDSVRESRRTAPGSVTRLSIAVLVDATAGRGVDLAQLRTLVGAAAGVDPGRGDTVTVAAMPLHTVAAAPAPAAVAPDHRRPVAAAVVVALLALLLAAAARRHHRRRARAVPDGNRLVVAAAVAVPAVAVPAVTVPAIDAPDRQRMIGRIADDPERAAAVLRDWTGPAR